jgi:hypothetical protein
MDDDFNHYNDDPVHNAYCDDMYQAYTGRHPYDDSRAYSLARITIPPLDDNKPKFERIEGLPRDTDPNLMTEDQIDEEIHQIKREIFFFQQDRFDRQTKNESLEMCINTTIIIFTIFYIGIICALMIR